MPFGDNGLFLLFYDRQFVLSICIQKFYVFFYILKMRPRKFQHSISSGLEILN